MPFQVHVLHIDFIDTQGNKHAIMKPAEVDLVIGGDTTRSEIRVSYNSVLLYTLVEGTDWTHSADLPRNAELISKLINQRGLTNQAALLAEWEVDTINTRIFAKMIGRGGTGYTVAGFHPGAAEIDVAGVLAAETVIFDTGGATYGPITLTEGIDFTDAATLAAAIIADGVLGPVMTADISGTLVRVYDTGGAVDDAALLAVHGLLGDTITGGAWSELNAGGAATQITSVVSNITIDGVASASLRDYTYDGRGPAQEVLQQFLDATVPDIGAGAGERLDGSLKVEFVPIPEGTQVMIMWEENA